MDILITLAPVVLIGGLFLLWITMLVHSIRNSIPHKLAWILLLIFTNMPGGILYYIVVYHRTAKTHQGLVRLLSIGAVVLAVIVLIGIWKDSSRTSLRTEEVSFAKILNYNVAGQIKRIEVRGDELTVTLKDASKPTMRSEKPPGTTLQDHGINTEEIEVVIKPAK